MGAFENLTCWTLSEPHLGMQNQAVGLAEALDVSYEIKHIRSRNFWKFLPPTLWPAPLNLNADAQPFAPPWPDILISSGRRSVATAIAIKKSQWRQNHHHSCAKSANGVKPI